MGSSVVLFEIDEKVFESKSELEAVYFTKPRLVYYYEMNCGVPEPAKKIYYFKKPKPEDYPINLNAPKSNAMKFICPQHIQTQLKYGMSSTFKKNVENLKKIKIFISRRDLCAVMYCYYRKKRMQKTIRVSRHNSDLHILFVNEDYNSACKPNQILQPLSRRWYEFRNNVFTDSLYYDPNRNEPDRLKLCGVHRSSFGEFEIIYYGLLDGIQAAEEFNDFDDLEALNTCRWVMTDVMTDSEHDNPLNYLFLWLRAYLANATDIYVAHVNSDDIVNKPVVHKHISELPKEYKFNWKPSICTGFLYKFLQEVNTLMSNDTVNSLNTVYEFYINPDNTVTYNIFENNPKKYVVTPGYMEYCKKQTSN